MFARSTRRMDAVRLRAAAMSAGLDSCGTVTAVALRRGIKGTDQHQSADATPTNFRPAALVATLPLCALLLSACWGEEETPPTLEATTVAEQGLGTAPAPILTMNGNAGLAAFTLRAPNNVPVDIPLAMSGTASCTGGKNPGTICTPITGTECKGICSAVGTGGTLDAECASSAQCGTGTCSGGTNAGTSCNFGGTECTGGGTCGGLGTCTPGICTDSFTLTLTPDVITEGVCADICVGGANAGEPCASSDQCGTGTCSGGDNDGASCTSGGAECTGGGTCEGLGTCTDNSKVCIGGDNAGTPCPGGSGCVGDGATCVDNDCIHDNECNNGQCNALSTNPALSIARGTEIAPEGGPPPTITALTQTGTRAEVQDWLATLIEPGKYDWLVSATPWLGNTPDPKHVGRGVIQVSAKDNARNQTTQADINIDWHHLPPVNHYPHVSVTVEDNIRVFPGNIYVLDTDDSRTQLQITSTNGIFHVGGSCVDQLTGNDSNYVVLNGLSA